MALGLIAAFIYSFVMSVTNRKSRDDKLGYCVALSLCNFALICALGNQVGLSVNPLFYGMFLFLSPREDFILNVLLVTVVPFVAGYLAFVFAHTIIESSSDELKNVEMEEGVQLKMKKPKELVFEV